MLYTPKRCTHRMRGLPLRTWSGPAGRGRARAQDEAGKMRLAQHSHGLLHACGAPLYLTSLAGTWCGVGVVEGAGPVGPPAPPPSLPSPSRSSSSNIALKSSRSALSRFVSPAASSSREMPVILGTCVAMATPTVPLTPPAKLLLEDVMADSCRGRRGGGGGRECGARTPRAGRHPFSDWVCVGGWVRARMDTHGRLQRPLERCACDGDEDLHPTGEGVSAPRVQHPAHAEAEEGGPPQAQGGAVQQRLARELADRHARGVGEGHAVHGACVRGVEEGGLHHGRGGGAE